MKAIEFRNVGFTYDGKTMIFENASFSVSYGELVLFSGHSGEGKSTLMYIASGIIPDINGGKLSGEVFINGENIDGKKIGKICRTVGVVLQNPDEQIVQKITEDEIAFGCENEAFPPEKIGKQIEIVCRLMNLDPRQACRTLSGGQKQRLMTASTLAMGQKIIILDEPLANLDKEGAETLMKTLRALTKVGYCVIVIEHRLDRVLPFVDSVYHVGGKRIKKIEDKQTYLEEQTAKIRDDCPVFSANRPAFSLNRVAFSIKSKQILNDVTCEIPKGGRTVLLGENGCGKTTLLRLLAGLYRPKSGKIDRFFDKKSGFGRFFPENRFKKVGFVFQNPDYQLFMPTVRREIMFSAVSPEKALETAALFGLEPFLDRHPHSLSEGQKRRLSLAAVLAGEPEVLLLDEPTVGQDYDGLCSMTEILNGIHQKTGNTMVTITHDLRCAEALCDTAFLIHNGTIVRRGGKDLVCEYFGEGRVLQEK